MTEASDWNDRYRDGNLPWDTGRPSTELQSVLRQHIILPCRALDIGCGTGTNSVWLAQQGFDVTGVDLAPLAIERAEQRARDAGVKARFRVADVLQLPDLGEPFGFFFDRRCYHAVRRSVPDQYAPALAEFLAPGVRGLILAGNARAARSRAAGRNRRTDARRTRRGVSDSGPARIPVRRSPRCPGSLSGLVLHGGETLTAGLQKWTSPGPGACLN